MPHYVFYGIEVYRSHGASQDSAPGMQPRAVIMLDARARVASRRRENLIWEECLGYHLPLSLFLPFLLCVSSIN